MFFPSSLVYKSRLPHETHGETVVTVSGPCASFKCLKRLVAAEHFYMIMDFAYSRRDWMRMDLMLDLWNQSGGGSQVRLHQPVPVIPLRKEVYSSMQAGLTFQAVIFFHVKRKSF